MDIKAIIFDFDGVFIDTEWARYLSWQRIYDSFQLTLPRKEWIKNIGRATYVADPFDILEQLSRMKLDRETFIGQHRINEVEIADRLPLLPGIVDRLAEADSLGIICGIASSSSHRWVDGHLQRRGLIDRFKVVICREDIGIYKPDPGPYLMALDRLGVDAVHTVAVEDSPTGVASARTAGIYCIGIPCSMTREMDLGAANLLVESLEAVSLRELMRLPLQFPPKAPSGTGLRNFQK